MPESLVQEATSAVRSLADQAFSRAAGAPLLGGNSVRILKDAAENYPAWMKAMESAQQRIHFESYIIYDDEIGQQFVDLLVKKARQGVRIRLIYDWLGAIGKTLPKLWWKLRDAGVEVRAFNRPQFESPFGWLSRDHRKMIAVDGRVAFVTGLCIGRKWVGDPNRGIAPWRDTGVEIRGPAVADIERAFAEMWKLMGTAIREEELPVREDLSFEGKTKVRVVASTPNTAALYRLDQLIAAAARRSLWLTDAYFIGTTSYIHALRAAAKDNVDVRLLVPAASDIRLIGPLSRAMYRPLLEAGVRVFEWNGPMLHAKTAVADGLWARVGSTNLNIASWIGNWELDVAVEDEPFATKMEEMYLDDLANSTEIVLTLRKRIRRAEPVERRRHPGRRRRIGRAAVGAFGVGSVVGAAITNRRLLGPAEARMLASAGLLLAAITVLVVTLGIFKPRAIAYPVIFFTAWFTISLLVRAYKLRNKA